MGGTLSEFLGRLTPIAREDVTWFGGAMKLRLQAFITTELPPLEYVTSVRAVLLSAQGCAVLSNVDGRHVLPGGRRDGDEPIEQTLRRELMEEAGCTLTTISALGVLHFRHLTPKPADYRYPYPDFMHIVFAARGTPMSDFAGDPEGYEQAVAFLSPAELEQVELPAYQRALLAAAVSLLG